jgi:type VI secretion system secreted protein VgrG
MATATQTERLLEVNTPLGKDALLIESFSGTETLSGLYSFHVYMRSEKGPVSSDSMLGKPMTVTVNQVDGKPRHFHGLVSRFGHSGSVEGIDWYYAEVVPWIWLLTRRSDCRIFQDQTVPDIVKQVFDKLGMKDYKLALTRTYTKWDYCVQYHETDFNFVSRLLEHEGIFYFFEFEEKKHTLVLADNPQANAPAPGQAKAKFEPVGGYGDREATVTSWQEEDELRPAKYSYRDHNFQLPDKSLQAERPSQAKAGGYDKLEMYDYPGNYANLFNKPDQRLGDVQKEGDTIAKLHLEASDTALKLLRGTSSCSAFAVGYRFDLTDYPNPGATAGPFLLTAIQHTAEQTSGYASDSSGAGYSNSFSCIPHKTPFRPARVTGKPAIQGPQTAVVVGVKGEEIYVDKFGRVKVQFFWDREHKKDENSSCWVRVAQPIAGKRWGASFWPRVGQEVIVAFLEGNPDHPLIVGSVYNADQMPPYLGDGFDSKHKNDPRLMGIKSNTTSGGKGFNELRFDDNKGKEQVFVHAERNMDTRVKNESMENVDLNRHLIVGTDKDGKKGDQYELVYQDKHLNVKRNQVEQVEGNLQLTIGAGEASDGGAMDLLVAGKKTETVGKDSDLHIKGDSKIKIDGGASLNVGGEQNTKVATTSALEAGTTIHIKSGATLVLEAGVQLSLKVGGNFIDINPAGVSIVGTMVMINSGGAAGSGPGANPQAPKDAQQAKPTKPTAADDSASGVKSAPG